MLNRSAESSVKLRQSAQRRNHQSRTRPAAAQLLKPYSLCEPLRLIQIRPSAESYERPNHYEIVVPIPGIDRRNVYVFAAPQSIVIEILTRNFLRHPDGGIVLSERTDQRIRREFVLRVPIEAGSTTVKFEGESVQIIATKSTAEEQEAWSEFIRFDL